MTTKKVILALIALGLSACSNMDLPDSSELGGLRILAITTQGTQAEFSPGDTVVLKPFVSYINFSGSLTYSAQACVDPGISYGASVSCDGNDSKIDLGSGSVTTLTTTDSMTGFANDISVVIPSSSIIFYSKSSKDQFNGVSYLVIYDLTASDGKTVRSFKRILVSNKSASQKNTNPVISDILQNGSSLSAISFGATTNLSASLDSGSAESFEVQNSDGSTTTKSEEVLVSWHVSDGTLKYIRTTGSDTTDYESPSGAPSGRKIFVIAVARDERGGQSILVRSF